MVEQEFSKLKTRVRSPSPAPTQKTPNQTQLYVQTECAVTLSHCLFHQWLNTCNFFRVDSHCLDLEHCMNKRTSRLLPSNTGKKTQSTVGANQLVGPKPSQLMKALPNLVTLAALAAGMSAIMFAIQGAFANAVACLVVAMVLDACDGRVARFVGTSSKFGAELDSLSDVVCFGAAPALLLHMWGLDEKGLLGWIACITLTSATALRLARFNVAVEKPNRPVWSGAFFQGVPSPAGGFLALLPFYLAQAGAFSVETCQTFAMLWVPFVAGLMVSNIPTFSGKLVSRVLSRAIALMALSIVAVTYALLVHGVWVAAIVLTLGYVLLFPLSILRHRHLSSRA
jgi:CDP-diacylglycerol---serine O-phosphatidyltransferase